MSTATGFKPTLWTPGDWNAFFGFGTNILVNMLVLTGLLRFVLRMPDAIVFGRILPSLGLMMCLSTFYYAWLAYRLAHGGCDVPPRLCQAFGRRKSSGQKDGGLHDPGLRLDRAGHNRRGGPHRHTAAR